MRKLCLVLTLFSMLPISTADGQTPGPPQSPLGGEPPTLGVRLLAPTVIGRSDSSSIETNPGALARVRGFSLRLVHSELRSDGRVQGTGTALFAAAPLWFYRNLVLGTSVQWVRPVDAIGYPDIIKLSLAAALRMGPWLTFGVSYHQLFSPDDDIIDDISTVDLGLTLTPLNWFSFGLAVRNLTTPDFAGLPIERVYDLEAAFRPLRNRRLEIGLGVTIGERRGTFDPLLRLRAFITPGLELFAHAQLLRRDFERDGSKVFDVRVSSGIEVSFERLSVAAAAVFGRSFEAANNPIGASGTRSAFQGGSFSLELRGQRRQPLFETHKKLLALTLGKKLDASRLISLHGVLVRLEKRADVSGVLVRLKGLSCGWGVAQEVASWIAKLRQTGKRVVVYLETAALRDYYIASAADEVWLDPAGMIMLGGISSGRMYLRGLFDKLNIKPNFERIAQYKSAPESFTNTDPSKESLEVRNSMLDQLYRSLQADIASHRKLRPKAVKDLIDHGPFVPRDALASKLIDRIVEPHQVNAAAARWARARLTPANKLFRSQPRWAGDPAIAVVALEGDIVDGKSSTTPLINRSVVGDKTIVEALNWARTRSSVRAVVLRIDSPGGSALASDHIWRAVRRLRQVKPVIVSMGDVAASGGYYAAAGGHEILAMPATITGSIGIYVGKFDLSGLLARVGININLLTRGKHALLRSMYRSFDAQERELVKKRLRYYYDAFVSAVATGRPLSKKEVDVVARGRVWSGSQARKVKLVDRIGSLSDAIVLAKAKAKLTGKRARLVFLPRPHQSLLGRALSLLSKTQTRAETPLPPLLRSILASIPPALWLSQAYQPMMRLPYVLSR